MDFAEGQLAELSLAAVAHARFAHGCEIGESNFAIADQILNKERLAPDRSSVETLAACYGAWIGSWANNQLDASWTGLHESQSPRLEVGGVICSPIDAVRRLLTSPESAVPLASLALAMRSWSDEA